MTDTVGAGKYPGGMRVVQGSLQCTNQAHSSFGRTSCPSCGDLFRLAQQCGIVFTFHPRVRVDTERVQQLSDSLRSEGDAIGVTAYAWDDPKFWPVDAEPVVRSQLLAIGNALNFRFWKRSNNDEIDSLGGRLHGEYFSGSMYMWRRLRLAFDAGVPVVDAGFLAAMDVDTLSDLFVDDDGLNPLSEAAGDRVANLRDLGSGLLDEWGGEFLNVVDRAGGSLPKFMHLSRRFRAFDDDLGKLTLVNALMHQGSGLTSFHEPLLPAIDYQIMKQLIRQHVLLPDLLLNRKIRNHQFLDGDEAAQLRSAALEALLLAAGAARLPGDFVDNQLWRNRTICSDVRPSCDICVFNSMCAKDITLSRPLQVTRHY